MLAALIAEPRRRSFGIASRGVRLRGRADLLAPNRSLTGRHGLSETWAGCRLDGGLSSSPACGRRHRTPLECMGLPRLGGARLCGSRRARHRTARAFWSIRSPDIRRDRHGAEGHSLFAPHPVIVRCFPRPERSRFAGIIEVQSAGFRSTTRGNVKGRLVRDSCIWHSNASPLPTTAAALRDSAFRFRSWADRSAHETDAR